MRLDRTLMPIVHTEEVTGSIPVPSTRLGSVGTVAVVDHTVWTRSHDSFVAVLRPYPVRGCAIRTQHFDDLNYTVLLSDDAAMDHKSVTDAGVHDMILSRGLTFSIPVTGYV
jgi:hypothetical protein